MFDTDGSITARKGENYKYPYIFITTTSKPLRRQLKIILRQKGFPASDIGNDISFRGRKNAEEWFAIIGSNNKRNTDTYKKLLNANRQSKGS